MKKQISIIIPIYNTEEFLTECIESILKQNLTSFEVIMINDGSTDNSEKLCKEYESKFENFHYYFQKNQGQGSARNFGIQKSVGKYLYFMDSDDVLKENSFQKILNFMENNDLEGMFFDGEILNNHNLSYKIGNYSRKESFGLQNDGQSLFLKFILHKEYSVSPCLYIIKKQVLENNSISFPEGIIHEDVYFTTLLMMEIGESYHCNEKIFKRRIRENSTMTTVQYEKSLKGYFLVFNKLMSFNKSKFINKQVYRAYKKQIFGLLITIIKLSNICSSNITKKIKSNKSLYFKYLGFKGYGVLYFYDFFLKIKYFIV